MNKSGLFTSICVSAFLACHAEPVGAGPITTSGEVVIEGVKYRVTTTLERVVDVPIPKTPAAPTGLKVVLAGTNATITWNDVSDNETAFAVWRKDYAGDGAAVLTDWRKVYTVDPNKAMGKLSVASGL